MKSLITKIFEKISQSPGLCHGLL